MDVLTAQEDGANQLPDAALLDRAMERGRILFSQDDDLLREATLLRVVYAHQLNVTIGQCVEDLELIGSASEFEEWTNRLEYLPLR